MMEVHGTWKIRLEKRAGPYLTRWERCRLDLAAVGICRKVPTEKMRRSPHNNHMLIGLRSSRQSFDTAVLARLPTHVAERLSVEDRRAYLRFRRRLDALTHRRLPLSSRLALRLREIAITTAACLAGIALVTLLT